MFIGQTVMCLVEVIVCVSTSGFIDGKFHKKPICVPTPVQRPANCKVIDMFSLDYEVAEVNCTEFFKKTKMYKVVDMPGNFDNQEVNQDLCSETNNLL